MSLFRYSRWDGTQQIFPFTADDIMAALSDDVLADGDLWRALEQLLQRGLTGQNGDRLEGLQQLLEQLRAQRQRELDRYDLSSVFDDLKQRLDEIKQLEREGIARRLEAQAAPSEAADAPDGAAVEAGEPPRSGSGEGQPAAPELEDLLRKMAARKLHQLDMLPADAPGQIKELSENYEFMDQQARQKFQELLDELKGQVMQQYFQGMKDMMQSLGPEDMQRMKDMMSDLNQMLRDRMQGKEPRFAEFMERYGDYFEPGLENLDQLLESLQRRMAQMQSLMDSMPGDMRQSLESMMQQMMGDPGMQAQMAELMANLEGIMPMRQFRGRYPFRGDENLSLDQAMEMMDRLQQLDDLERQLRRAQQSEDVADLDLERVGDLLGAEARAQLQQLQQLTRVLEEAGYIKKDGDGYELTSRGTRKIGQKALEDIFANLKKDSFGKHAVQAHGHGGDRTDDTKSYDFGDPFLIDIQKTLMNSIQRDGAGTPVQVGANDFEVYRSELITSSSTVLMLDMSRSMLLRGCFLAAKKVAVALHSLIRTQYPRDELYILGFSDAARELTPERLPNINWNEYVYGTNMQHGFMMARQLLARHKSSNKQIIMITDGEPTAYFDHGRVQFSYPPTYRTFQETLREVHRCTRENIVINTFMLERSHYLTAFVNQMTKINKGRAFFVSPDRLGEYILVDYLDGKRTKKAA